MFNYLALDNGLVLGAFIEKEFGRHFTYEANTENCWVLREDFPHKIHMCDGSFRKAHVLKTVAKVIVDEDERGMPVVETWQIKQNKKYK